MKKTAASPELTGNEAEPEPIRRALLEWFDRSRRDLPWRKTQDPYAVWISEVMLQQTRVDVAIPRYTRFLRRFPSVADLAEADEEDVVAEWSGLGYYGRARNLHAAARGIIREHGGRFPKTREQAVALAGVGAYTAHAVLSIAYGLPLAVVDGNVTRVLSRLYLLSLRPSRRIQEAAERLLSRQRPGDANQAMMELGATVCLPKNPRCGGCPLQSFCHASRTNQVDLYPQRSRKKHLKEIPTSLWIMRNEAMRIWLERRTVPPLRGLWMLPWREAGGDGVPARRLGAIRHAIMDRRYRCEVYEFPGPPEVIPGIPAGPGSWVGWERIRELPHSSLLVKALAISDSPIGRR